LCKFNLIIFLYNLPPILCTKPASVNILFPHIDRTNKLITVIIIANVNNSPARAKNITAAFHAFKPTIGIFNRCQKYNHLYSISDRETCANFVTDFMGENDDFPHAWKAAVIFFALDGY
jgi:hypothetical protein